MGYPKASLIKRVRRELDDEPWESYLTAAYTAGSGQISVADPTQLSEGDVLEFADGTQLRVQSTPSANPVSVKGGHNDTTDTSQANGAVFVVNPEFAYHEIEEAISTAIAELWPWVWRVATTTITASQGRLYYPLPADFRELIAVTQDLTPAGGQPRVLRYGSRGSGYPVGVARQLPTSVSASGIALVLPAVRTTPSDQIVVTYAALVRDQVTAGNYDDLEDGLLATAVIHGACAELLEIRETERLQDDVEQGDIGVPAGARMRDAVWYRERFSRMRERLALRLTQEYPIASRWER